MVLVYVAFSTSPVLSRQNARGVPPPAEQTNLDVRAGYGKGFLALHGLKQRRARVLLSPHASQSRGAFNARVKHPADQSAGHARLDRPVRKGMTTEEVVLTVGGGGVGR